jgi:hypothetical protein
MANPKHLEIARQGKDAWNKWRKENPDEPADFTGLNFTRLENRIPSFAGFEFGDNARFDRATLDVNNSFKGSSFGDGSSFFYTKFEDGFSFQCSAFGHGVNFERAVFGRRSNFAYTGFGIGCSFIHATFGS